MNIYGQATHSTIRRCVAQVICPGKLKGLWTSSDDLNIHIENNIIIIQLCLRNVLQMPEVDSISLKDKKSLFISFYRVHSFRKAFASQQLVMVLRYKLMLIAQNV